MHVSTIKFGEILMTRKTGEESEIEIGAVLI